MLAVRRLVLWRFLPVLVVTIAVGYWINDIQESGPFVFRNLVPLFFVSALALFTVLRGDGRWTGSGVRLLFGTIGYSIPALGLSSYIHYAYSVNLNGLFTGVEQPARVFEYLPLYTSVAGAIGFAIGWIAGRDA